MMSRSVLALICFLALAAASSDKKVVCYFGSWAVERPGNGKFDINLIDPKLCTHLIYTFVGVNNDGSVKILGPHVDLELRGYEKVKSLRKLNPKLKTMIAMGGYGDASTSIPAVVKNPSLRSNLVWSIVKFVKKYGFDGLDLDWEYPEFQDKQNMVTLLEELKHAFEPLGLILSVAVGATPSRAESSYDIAKISKYVDFINLMEYDYHGSWDRETGHNAPLYAASWEKGPQKTLNVDASIKYWLQHGAPPEKIIMGIPFYAKSFTLTNPSNKRVNAPDARGTTSGPYTQTPESLGYNEICENMDKWHVTFDEEQRVPYAHHGNHWISFDNERSIAEKADYVKKYGLGGMMIWSIETDDFRGICGKSWPLLRAINKNLYDSSGSTFTENFKTNKDQSPEEIYGQPEIPISEGELKNAKVSCTSGSDMIPNPDNCNTFYMCQYDNSGFIPILMSCPQSLFFNPVTLVCDYKYNVQCQM